MVISLFTLSSPLHKETAADVSQESFIKGIEEASGEKFIFHGDDFSLYGESDADLIYVRTGGTEGLFKKVLDSGCLDGTGKILLLSSGKSNSLAASMEILSFLHQKGLKGEILHGSAETISASIGIIAGKECNCNGSSNGNSGSNGNGSCRHSIIRKFEPVDLGGARIAVIGRPSDWLISSDVDYRKAEEKMNVQIVDIPMSELLSELPLKLSGNCVDMRSFDGSLAIYDALKALVRRHNLKGLTLRCFDLLDTVHNTGCLALAKLNAEGIPAACEGDVPALLSMMYLQKVQGRPGFQCNLSRIENGKFLFAHCTVPLNMLESYRYDTHFESGTGTAIKGEMSCREIEIFKIAPDLEHFVRIKGCISENRSETSLCRTQILVVAPGAEEYFLQQPLANHHIISYL